MSDPLAHVLHGRTLIPLSNDALTVLLVDAFEATRHSNDPSARETCSRLRRRHVGFEENYERLTPEQYMLAQYHGIL